MRYSNSRQLFVQTIFLLCSLLALPSHAADALTLEQQLTNALKVKPGTTDRLAEPDPILNALKQQNVISKKANSRGDYTDYYLVSKPFLFMKHEVVVVENEYMAKYVGCCVSPGMGLVLKINGSTKPLKKFATTNGCTFDDGPNAARDLSFVDIKTDVSRGKYATLSCRETDISRWP